MGACGPTCLHFNSCAQEWYVGAEPDKGVGPVLQVEDFLGHLLDNVDIQWLAIAHNCETAKQS